MSSGTTPNPQDVCKPEAYMPTGIQIAIIGVLLCLSGLFSGLNLGLMALDTTELAVVAKCGTKQEQKYASVIYPIRKLGNYLLCSLLLGNVIVNTAISMLMDNLSNGPVSIVPSTIGIVIFGEIVPQSICTRYGLAVGANTRYLTYFFMLLTFPLSYPISKILDCILGDETGQVMSRDRLFQLVEMSADLKKVPEMSIVTGALKLKGKYVSDIMTKIEHVYMVPCEAILDLDTINDIVNSGYTRVPIYLETSDQRLRIVALLNVKDLALIDPGDKVPISTVCKYYRRPVRTVLDDMPLMQMMDEFKAGRYHMSFVEKLVKDPMGNRDPYYEVIGVVTLEDIIEEILQAEIVDETDMITDNKFRRPVAKGAVKSRSASAPAKGPENRIAEVPIQVSKQLCMAAFQVLTTNYPMISKDISEHVLQRLILFNVHRIDSTESKGAQLYKKGVPADYFVLVLEGYLTVTLDSDTQYQAGPFHAFGAQVLQRISKICQNMAVIEAFADNEEFKKAAFTPDFSTKFHEGVTFLKIGAFTYFQGHKATAIERRGGAEHARKSRKPSGLRSAENVSGKSDPRTRTSGPGSGKPSGKSSKSSGSVKTSGVKEEARSKSGTNVKSSSKRKSAGTEKGPEVMQPFLATVPFRTYSRGGVPQRRSTSGDRLSTKTGQTADTWHICTETVSKASDLSRDRLHETHVSDDYQASSQEGSTDGVHFSRIDV